MLPVTGVPARTNTIVAGSEQITAIGQSAVVIHGATLTYKPGRSTTTEVNGDSVTLGPDGVIVHGTTIGGANMQPGDTRYEPAGGATITEIGRSVVIIEGSTFTIGPSGGLTNGTTTTLSGETVTVGPSGVSVSGATFPYPFGPTVTTTIVPTASGTAATAEENAGGALRTA